MKHLLPQLSPRRKSLQSGRRHPGFQFKIELVKQVSFGLEVGKQRAVRYASLSSYHRRRRAQPMSNNHAGRCRNDRAPFVVASRPSHAYIIIKSEWTVKCTLEIAYRFVPDSLL